MKTGNLLFSAVHLFVTCFILGVGVFFIALPYASSLRIAVINTLLEPTNLWRTMGIATLVFGTLLFMALFRLNRRSFLKLDVAGVDKGIIQGYALNHFQKKFPEEEWTFEVVVSPKGKLEILTVGMGKLEEEEFEEEWRTFLGKHFHYNNPFTLTFVGT